MLLKKLAISHFLHLLFICQVGFLIIVKVQRMISEFYEENIMAGLFLRVTGHNLLWERVSGLQFFRANPMPLEWHTNQAFPIWAPAYQVFHDFPLPLSLSSLFTV